jgi:magnesium chelatase accessory protein
MSGALDWAVHGQDWPHRDASQFVVVDGTRWHVQVMGSGAPLLLIHGTGAATHSWRTLAPLLASRYTVIAPDLPGHGFTTALRGAHTLPAMADALGRLLGTMALRPVAAIGHSAGAAIAVRMTLDGRLVPTALASLAGALLPWRGLPALVFAPLARLLVSNSSVPRFLAARAAEPAVMSRLVDSTGSLIDARGVALYSRLASNPAHVAGALAMMADWDLVALKRDLGGLRVPLLALHGARDRMVGENEFRRVAALVPRVDPVTLPALGHLAHEEDAATCARIIVAFLIKHGL